MAGNSFRVVMDQIVQPGTVARSGPSGPLSSTHIARGAAYVRAVLQLAATRYPEPWKGERSPAFQASRSPGVLSSQSGRISRVTTRRSCQMSATEGRPQNQ